MAAVYPATLRAVAASGSLYYGRASYGEPGTVPPLRAMVLAPSANGQLELLAGDSIHGGDLSISRSSAAPQSLATILHPAFLGFLSNQTPVNGSGNLSSDGSIADFTVSPLFAFGPNTASMAWGDALAPARFYALSGDLLGVNSGRALSIYTARGSTTRADLLRRRRSGVDVGRSRYRQQRHRLEWCQRWCVGHG